MIGRTFRFEWEKKYFGSSIDDGNNDNNINMLTSLWIKHITSIGSLKVNRIIFLVIFGIRNYEIELLPVISHQLFNSGVIG